MDQLKDLFGKVMHYVVMYLPFLDQMIQVKISEGDLAGIAEVLDDADAFADAFKKAVAKARAALDDQELTPSEIKEITEELAGLIAKARAIAS